LIKIVGPVKVEIPCVDNIGSCSYKDICSMLPAPDNCPSFFKEQNIPCTCPFPGGNYDAKNIQIEIDLPARIPPGQYSIIANLENGIGHVACVQVNLNLK
jgi:ganglioside GM2 activator